MSIGSRNVNDAGIMRTLLLQARPYWGHICALVAIGLCATPLALLMPVPLKIVVDHVVGTNEPTAWMRLLLPDAVLGDGTLLLIASVVLLILIVLLNQAQSLSEYVLSTYVGERLTLNFRALVFRHLQRLTFAFHDRRGTADSIYRLQYDTSSVQNLLIFGILPLVSSGILILTTLYVTTLLSWRLAAVAVAVLPLLFYLTQRYKKAMRPAYRDMKELESGVLGVMQEVLTSLRVVKAFGREEQEHERFLERSGRSVRAKVRISAAEGLLGLSINATTALGTAAVLFIGARSIQAGTLTIGELLVVMAYLSQLYGPMKSISQKAATLQGALSGAERALELLHEVPDVQERPDARPLRRARGDIAFRHVDFSYDDGVPVLRNVSFHVAAGTRIGIAGRTGAGKSTLLSILTRFYDPTRGTVLLDGVDLRAYKLDDLRNQFAVVLQDAVLFSTTIGENIAYGRPGATAAEVESAARAADAHEFIVRLPDGYDTRVGERGLRLSGGQRQRISLARAFLKDAPILILDEPTSAVDVGTEASILHAMDRLMDGRTTFMVAHRTSTLSGCSSILVLENGEVVPAEPVEAQQWA